MTILLFFAFLSGLVTIFAPCIWPVLPIILSSSTSDGHKKPLGITLGIMLSFTIFTLTISYIVSIIPFDPTILRYFSVIIIGFLGLSLVIPRLAQVFEGYVSRLSGKFSTNNKQDSGFKSAFITGLSLGIVWTPCAGPILATIATLAATQAVNYQIILVTIAYVIGIGIPLFILATVGQRVFTKTKGLNKYTGRIQQIFGVIMILTAISIATGYDRTLQAKLLNAIPSYSKFLTNLETNETVTKQLDTLRGNDSADSTLAIAPEFVGINNWLNTDYPVKMADLKGKVVLIDFWTYTCINCIRTLPYLTSWYEKYKDQGLVIIGVHSPEFEFEKQTNNVLQAIDQYNIQYPVAQDNDFATWKAYDNQYWPAKYLVDAKGVIRYTHFGEGEYEVTEKMIQDLLKEAGKNVNQSTVKIDAEQPMFQSTPETYLGLARMERVTNKINNRGTQNLTSAAFIPLHTISFSGEWNVQSEYSASDSNSELYLHFKGSKVFLVITPKAAGDVINVLLDGKPIPTNVAGKDIIDGKLILDKPRLYELVDLKGTMGERILKLEFEAEGTEVFAFTFG